MQEQRFELTIREIADNSGYLVEANAPGGNAQGRFTPLPPTRHTRPTREQRAEAGGRLFTEPFSGQVGTLYRSAPLPLVIHMPAALTSQPWGWLYDPIQRSFLVDQLTVVLLEDTDAEDEPAALSAQQKPVLVAPTELSSTPDQNLDATTVTSTLPTSGSDPDKTIPIAALPASQSGQDQTEVIDAIPATSADPDATMVVAVPAIQPDPNAKASAPAIHEEATIVQPLVTPQRPQIVTVPTELQQAAPVQPNTTAYMPRVQRPEPRQAPIRTQMPPASNLPLILLGLLLLGLLSLGMLALSRVFGSTPPVQTTATTAATATHTVAVILPSITPTPTNTATVTPRPPTATRLPSPTPSMTNTPSPTSEPTVTPTSVPPATPTNTPSATATSVPVATATPTIRLLPTASPTVVLLLPSDTPALQTSSPLPLRSPTR